MSEIVSVKPEILALLGNASVSLSSAFNTAQGKNPMCASVGVFQRIQAMQKELNTIMVEVNRVQGL